MSLTSKQNRVEVAIQQILAGDGSSYEIIYDACDCPLRAFIGARYKHCSDDYVDEVAIRTHERVLSKLHEYNPDKGSSFQTWMNWQALAEASKVKEQWFGSRMVHLDEEKHEPWAVTSTGPAEEYAKKQRSRVLWQEYERLAGDGRLSVSLHDLDGLTFAKTAEKSGLPLIRVRREREQALKKLRRALRRRKFNPVEVDSTPVPIWGKPDTLGNEDDWAAPALVPRPDGPDTLVDAAAKEQRKEELEE